MIATPKQLRALGIMGMNERNGDFIQRYNPRHLYPLVDDKLKTKELAAQHGIAVPELYTVIEIEHEVRDIEQRLAPFGSFVIKPANGAGGKGVWVIDGKVRDCWRKSSGVMCNLTSLQHYVSNILNGMYSLGGLADKAIVEYLVKFDPFFETVSYQGVPDIRVIVFLGIPVAAMVRLPTRRSDGKANLHQGAIGVGIQLDTGMTGHAVSQGAITEIHPDTGGTTAGMVIPHWDKILNLATRCADMVGLGYIGVDIVLDRDLGPLVLELNARPGLNVQLANEIGLLHKLRHIESLPALPVSAEDRCAYAQMELIKF